MTCNIKLEWQIRAQYREDELGTTPFDIYFFLGSIPTDTDDWQCADSCIATIRPYTTWNGRDSTPKEYYSGLTDDLKKVHNPTLTDNDVIAYIERNLSWRMMERRSCKVIDPADIKYLQVAVLAQDPVNGKILEEWEPEGSAK